ncbi:hypothetical protein [Flavobacterium tructae]|uniref:hypothetical protein n=1 Tax=Flavobacterium tructae TaxID=1114873 RepID=UPI0035A90245
MKNLILLLSLIFITACSSSDEDTQGVFHSPSWIQGSWKDNTTGAILTFTKNDIKYNTNGNTYSFSKNQIRISSNQIIPQQIAKTDNLYIVDFGQGLEGSLIRFNFFKKTDNTIESKGHLPGNYTRL